MDSKRDEFEKACAEHGFDHDRVDALSPLAWQAWQWCVALHAAQQEPAGWTNETELKFGRRGGACGTFWPDEDKDSPIAIYTSPPAKPKDFAAYMDALLRSGNETVKQAAHTILDWYQGADVPALAKKSQQVQAGEAALDVQDRIGARMPDGSVVTNVYDAFEAGKRAALSSHVEAGHQCNNCLGVQPETCAFNVEAVQQDTDPNADWLTLAHTICTDAGIPHGHISDRLKALQDKLGEAGQEGGQEALLEQVERVINMHFTGKPDRSLLLAEIRALKTAAPVRQDHINDAVEMVQQEAKPEQDADMAKRVLNVCQQRGWSLRWDARLAQMTLESAEFAEAVRGKRGDKTEEAGDMLFVLMSWAESAGVPWSDVVAATGRKCSKLEVVPRYAGEQFESAPPQAEAQSKEKTMDDAYGDGSDHISCGKCGLCKNCGDCAELGCGDKQAQSSDEGRG